MKKSEIIDVSKRMVKEYYNRYIAEPKGIEKITSKDVRIVTFNDNPYKCQLILATATDDDLHYGVSYNKRKKEMNSYIYKKIDEIKTIGKKEDL